MIGGIISERGYALKDKIQSKEFGKKIMTMFGKKSQPAHSEPVEEEKEEEPAVKE